MNDEPRTCPYCNARLDGRPGAAAGRVCPRCGELLPNRYAADAQGPEDWSGVPAAGSVPRGLAATPPAVRRRGRKTVALLLGAMLLMAVIGLVVSLRTVPGRRMLDPKDPISYLPADTDVVAFVQFEQILHEVAGRRFLTELPLGSATAGLESLERWTGISRENIQAVALGLTVGGRLLPRFVLVLQTIKPYNPAELREYLKGAESMERGGKTLYRFSMGEGGLRGTVWYAGRNVLVFGLTPDDLDAVPEEPRPGGGQLAPPISECLRTRIPPDAQAWLVASSENWGKTLALPWFARRTKGAANLLDQLRTACAWARFDEEVSATVACQMKDSAAAQALQRVVAASHTTDGQAPHTETGGWVVWSFRGGPESLTETVGQSFGSFLPSFEKNRPSTAGP